MDPIAYLISFLSYRVVAVCLASVPLTHILGLYFHAPSTYQLKNLLLFPLTGGNRHIVFQILAWGLWGLSSLVILPVILTHATTKPLPVFPHTHVDVLSGTAASCSFIGEMFMVKALLVYDMKEPASSSKRKVASPTVATAVVMFMGLLMTITGGLLLLSVEYMPDIPSRVLYCCLSLSCLCIAASSTYGLGGFLRFVKGEEAPVGSSDWQFFQPFSGGSIFVATQALGWSLFSATLVAAIMLIRVLLSNVAYCLRCWAYSVGGMMFATQLVLGVSVLTFQRRGHVASTTSQLAKALTDLVLSPQRAVLNWLGRNMPVIMMYLPVHIFFTVWTLTFTFAPFKWALAFWVAVLLPYYVLTMTGDPAHTGCRRWPWMCDWMTRNLEPALTSWFGGVKVTKAFEAPLDPAGRYIFCLLPHGFYPTGAGMVPLLPSFKRQFEGINIVTLTASALHHPPGIRDVVAWAGFRQVTRRTFLKALDETNAVLICPGGQAELVHTWRAFKAEPEIVVHIRHKGFCRMAIEQQAALLPVLALGETLQLRNLIDAPAIQQYTYKRMGFPFPFLLVGRWLLGFNVPMKVELMYFVGEPIHPPLHKKGEEVPQQEVDEMHSKFYAAISQLFDQYKNEHPRYRNARLVMESD